MEEEFIPVCEPALGEAERRHLLDAFDSGWISGGGPYNKLLEKGFANFLGLKYASTVANGTAALHLAIRALNLQSGDEVIVPNFNGIYGVYSLLYENLIPVPVDAEIETWNIDPELIEEKITPKTKAIMVVHIYGCPCDMAPIMALADKYQLSVIEDAAEAHGATYNNIPVGSIGDIGTFSFYGNKIVTSGEGGLVVTGNERYYRSIEYLKNQGFSSEVSGRFLHEDIAYNYRLSNIQASIAYAQFMRLNELLELRISLNKRYRDSLSSVEGIIFPQEKSYAKNVYWVSAIIVDEKLSGFSRDQLEEHLGNDNIQTRRFFIGMNQQPVLIKRGLASQEEYKVSDYISRNGLYLPSSPVLTEKNVERIVESIATLQ